MPEFLENKGEKKSFLKCTMAVRGQDQETWVYQ